MQRGLYFDSSGTPYFLSNETDLAVEDPNGNFHLITSLPPLTKSDDNLIVKKIKALKEQERQIWKMYDREASLDRDLEPPTPVYSNNISRSTRSTLEELGFKILPEEDLSYQDSRIFYESQYYAEEDFVKGIKEGTITVRKQGDFKRSLDRASLAVRLY